MAWLHLALAVVFEVGGAMAAKQSMGLTKGIPSTLTICLFICSFILLTLAMKRMEVSTAYGIWTGSSIILTTLVGIFFLQESMDVSKVLATGCLLAGVMGLIRS